MKLNGYHKHIDNGGIDIEVHQSDDEYKNITVDIKTSYYGYPAVSCSLFMLGTDDMCNPKEVLRDIGLMLITASDKVK